jgi:DNA-binding NarL/FixJ family response regulator
MVRPLIQSSKPADGGLTRREHEVLRLVVAGHPNKDVARACGVSEETIKHHLTRIFDKVGASNRLELATIATKRGLVDPSGAEPGTPSSFLDAPTSI